MVAVVDKVWATDITYFSTQRGILYLVAIVDLFFRDVLSWRLPTSLDTEFAHDALEIVLESGHYLDVFYFDQGCQFISTETMARL